ncbi:MAG: exodeoxyribonuclease V subunit beta [Rubrivivax sp.]|nr:exodeoxyribonuclease V subunit beta [Rubrivivax sp.]
MITQPLDVFHDPLEGTTLIEASAGTGKTWNLCALVLRLLLERGLALAQVLVVTFTKAATAELRERIRARLVDVLDGLHGGPMAQDPFVAGLLGALRGRGLADEDMAKRLQVALQTFDEASIFTIHGFCQRALSDTPFAAALPMSTELLADDGELQLQVVNDFWRRRLAGDTLDPALAALLVARGDTPARWAALLKRQVGKPLSRTIWPADVPPAADGAALVQAFAEVQALWAAGRQAIVARVREALPRLNARSHHAESLATAAQGWDRLLAAADAASADYGLDKLDLLTAPRLQPKKGLAPPAPHPFFETAATLLALQAQQADALAAQRLALLRELLTDGPVALRALKRERRVVAFDDLLHDLQARLTGAGGAALAQALRARWPVALIDEFQDTDPLQWAIFHTLHGEAGAPLFLLGDPKQAIYSFRHADLHTYLQARRSATATRSLAENQRSTADLLVGLNAIFGAHARGFLLEGLDHPPAVAGARPRPVLIDRSAARAPLQLWQLPPGADGGSPTKAEARRAAAHAVAGEVARLLAAARRDEVTLDGRPLAAGDIAVLVRSHAQGAAMRQALAAQGVGSIELSQADVHRSVDAEELERVLAAMLAPTREPTLRAALATELMGLDATTIDALAQHEATLLAHVTRFAGYRDTWLQRGVGPMLRRWLQQEAVAPRLLQRPDGERRLTNVLHLAERLQEAAAQHAAPEALLRWLQQQRVAGGGGDAAQLRLESDRDLVPIVTIHKSKGLEYPLVFCPFLWDGHPGPADALSDGFEYHDDEGRPVIDFRPGKLPAVVKAQRDLERAAEHARLVYVALTRAVQRCVLVVGPYVTRKSASEAGRAPLNWLVAGAGRDPATLARQPLAPDAITAAWAALAAAQAPQVDLQPLPLQPVPPLPPQGPAPEALAALPAPPPVATAWWVGSYSSLVRGLRHEGAARDHDDTLAPDEAVAGAAAAAPADDDDILAFPRGPAAGECLHAVFEQADFADPATWPDAVAQALRRHPQPPAAADETLRRPRRLLRLLGDVLHTPLQPGLQLHTVPATRRLVEWEFNLPVARLAASALAATLHAHGMAAPVPGFATLRGYLRGFIDLVFEHQGRWYIVDWKSNHLGHTAADYAAPGLARAMAEHGYELQALLYAVALHRHLGRRLAGYDFDRHVGGVLMLFVRGVRPGWVDGQGRPCGVHAVRPTRALIEDLSALLGDARGTA